MRRLLPLLLAVQAGACGTEGVAYPAVPRCAEGDLRACTCPDGRGSTQFCRPDGVFDPCVCDEEGQPAEAASGGSQGQPPLRPEEDASRPGADVGLGNGNFDLGPLTVPDAAPRDGCIDPEYVTIGAIDLFKYEASHPLATPEAAFPGAQSQGLGPRAPGEPANPCSRPGVRPWHTIPWSDARDACERIGWRLCSEPELVRACEGSDGRDWTWGPIFDGAACNLRQVYLAPGAETASEAPTGHFPRCVSEEGAYDLSGNLWEWTSDETRYLGAGWRIVAERHREEDLVCRARGVAGAGYASPEVGFRCCRAAQP